MINPASFGGRDPLHAEAWYVYILQCRDDTYYVGCTSDLEGRLIRHAKGQIRYTSVKLPVRLQVYLVFTDKYLAFKFEKYLKSGSGRAFAKRHLLLHTL
jgi:putative endonuclease